MRATTALFIVFVLLPLCFAAPQHILFGNLAATLVAPISATSNPTLVLKPLAIDQRDGKQQWTITADGYIQSAATGFAQVFDVNGASTTANSKVLLYPKTTPAVSNQKWNITNGIIRSKLTSNYFLAPNSTKTGLVVNYAAAVAATLPSPSTSLLPWICQSTGDPHIYPFTSGQPGIANPGIQFATGYILASVGTKGAADYVHIQATSALCRASVPAGPFCNKNSAIQVGGHTITIEGDVVTVNGVTTTVTSPLSLANGVSIVRNSKGSYTVKWPTGYMTSTQVIAAFPYTNILVALTGGTQPTGGVCQKFMGNGAGAAAPNRKRVDTPTQFLTSWRTPNKSEDLFYYATQLAWRAANPETVVQATVNWTTTNTTLNNIALAQCALLAPSSSLVAQCGSIVPAEEFYIACLADIIGGQDDGAGASIVDGFCARCGTLNSTGIVLPTSGRQTLAYGPGLSAQVALGEATSFTIDARDANGKNITVAGDTFTISSLVSYSVAYSGNGKYLVSYTPTTAGTFNVGILHNGLTHISGSPFPIQVVSLATSPAHCTASGSGLQPTVTAGIKQGFVIQARTSEGNPRTAGGDIFVVSIGGWSDIDPVEDLGDGTYSVGYQQEFTGNFPISVKIGAVHIAGSPFPVEFTFDK